MTNQNRLVSVIVPTFNSGNTISSCLGSIRSQTYSNSEIIVVDRFSSDATVPISEQYDCKIIRSPEKRSSARNIGASNASGDFLIFIDSDMRLSPTTIDECVNVSRMGSFDSLIVPEVSVGVGFWSKCIAFEKLLYMNNNLIESPCFFSRSCFAKIDGYDASLEAGEDWDITSRLVKNSCRIGRVKSLIYHNEERTTLAKLFRKKYYYGHTIFLYSQSNPALARAQLSPKRFLNKPSVKMMIRSPDLGTGLVIMKAVEFSALILGSK